MPADKGILMVLWQDESAGEVFTVNFQVTVQKFQKASKSSGQSRGKVPAGLT